MTTSTLPLKRWASGRSKPNLSGASLIEVLILVVVLSVGMLAMAKIHSVLLRDGGTAANRAIATSLAEEKLDDLRSYKWIDQTAAGTAASEVCGTRVFCYSDIGPNVGGAIVPDSDPATLVYPSGPIPVNNVTFNRSWTVSDLGQYKLVTVTVTWTDTNGDGTVSLESAIAPNDINAASAAAGGVAITALKPQVNYTALGVPDVVPIQINSNGDKKETSKPLPEVSTKFNSVVTEFESVTYQTSGTNKRQTVESYATVGCVCEFVGEGDGLPPAYFSNVDGALTVVYPTQTVKKMTGKTAVIPGEKQDPLCDSCCANHHDRDDIKYPDDRNLDGSSKKTALYDPDVNRRSSSNITDKGNHTHYYFSVDSAQQPEQRKEGLVPVFEDPGQKYLEACRFLRVDGIYRLMQDWRLVDLTVMPKNYLTEGSPALSSYESHVKGVVEAQAQRDLADLTDPYLVAPRDPFSKSLAGRDLLNQPAGSSNQLAARGIYVDRVLKRDAPRELDTSHYGTTTPVPLDKVPFSEINVTLLASWDSKNLPLDGIQDPLVVTVTNETLKTLVASSEYYAGTYSRGRTVVQGSASSGAGEAQITAYMLPSNSGLVGGATRENFLGAKDYTAGSVETTPSIAYSGPIGIDPNDHASALRKSDSLKISRPAGGTTRIISGTIVQANSSAVLNALQVSGTNGASCTIDVTSGQATFSCTVAKDTASDITVTTGQTDGFIGTGSVGTGSGTSFDRKGIICNSAANANTCTPASPFYAFGPTARLTGSCSASGGASCSNGYSMSVSGAAGAVCVAGAAPYCDVPVTQTTASTSPYLINITVSGLPTCGNDKIPKNCVPRIDTSANSAKCTGPSPSPTTPLTVTGTTAANRPAIFDICVN